MVGKVQAPGDKCGGHTARPARVQDRPRGMSVPRRWRRDSTYRRGESPPFSRRRSRAAHAILGIPLIRVSRDSR